MAKSNVKSFRIKVLGVLILIPVCFVSYVYIKHQITRIPEASIPENATLINHQPDNSEFHSSVSRYWYYEKYSVSDEPGEVLNYFQGIGASCNQVEEDSFSLMAPYFQCIGEANPDGYFVAEFQSRNNIQVSNYVKPESRNSLALPMQLDPGDPEATTIIFVEVSWKASD